VSFLKTMHRLDKLTLPQLVEREAEVCRGATRPATGPWLYDPATRRKLDLLRWAITQKLSERRASRGPLDGGGG
jgi:hypothetical protein